MPRAVDVATRIATNDRVRHKRSLIALAGRFRCKICSHACCSYDFSIIQPNHNAAPSNSVC